MTAPVELRITALVAAAFILVGADPLPFDAVLGQQVVAGAVTGGPDSGGGCARTYARVAAKSRALAEENADGLAIRLGGRAHATLAAVDSPHDWTEGASLQGFGPRCSHGGASVEVTVVRSASIPELAAPSDADRAQVSSTFTGFMYTVNTAMRTPWPFIYAVATVPGEDDRIAARLAADRARRAAVDLSMSVVGLTGVVAFQRPESNAARNTHPPRFFYPPPSITIGVAVQVANTGNAAVVKPDPSVRIVGPDSYETVSTPVATMYPLRMLTVETDVPADEIIATAFVPDLRSYQIVAALRNAGIEARPAIQPMRTPIVDGADVVLPPNEAATDAQVARIRALFPQRGSLVVTRPHLRSCEAIENKLRAAAFAALHASGPSAVTLGPLKTTVGSCGAALYSTTGATTSSSSVTARMMVGVW
jgi:hypothetical protein